MAPNCFAQSSSPSSSPSSSSSLNEEGERIFEGSTGSSNGAGSGTSILISGRVYSYAGQSRATISYASGASYYAKVNNSEFTNSASKRFNAKVVLVK
jgi:hypothetical protein